MPNIAVIPGDGVGQEVMAEALRLIDALNGPMKLNLTLKHFDFGADRYLKTGISLPEGQIEDFKNNFDAILFGAVGDPRVKNQVHAREILLALRFGLDLYINFRPCFLLNDRLSPLKNKGRAHIQIAIFRENTEGQYNGVGGFLKTGTLDEIAVSEEINTRRGVERIVRAAFEWADVNKKKKVALAEKSNAIPAHELWVRVFKKVAQEFPHIQARQYYVDALAMQLVLKPEDFEVIVTNNLFGDILTDIGSALVGGLGMSPSASLNRESTPLFEPVHGSAPDIAGQGIVNPMAMMLTVALMLRHLGHSDAAQHVETAVTQSVAASETTADLGGTLKTQQVATHVIDRTLALIN